jgi:hypothetical protein
MGNKIPGIVLLATAIAVTGFYVFHDTPPHSQTPGSSSPVALSGAAEFDKTGNALSNAGADAGGHGDTPAGKGGTGAAAVELQERYAQVSDNPDYPRLQARLDAMRKRHPNRSFDPERVVETMAQSEAWTRVDTPPEGLPLTPEEKFDGREFIRFNPQRVETLMPGDTLEIPVWQLGTRYKMRVDHAEIHPNGSVTWHGHLENFNEPHRVILTVGDGLSLGGIETPNGHYVLQANGEAGWIASSETLFKRNEHETDMVIPPAEESEGSS